jgi:hypothetical protein
MLLLFEYMLFAGRSNRDWLIVHDQEVIDCVPNLRRQSGKLCHGYRLGWAVDLWSPKATSR